ncbi:putative O-linked N-acetylglucosamine transferase (SPINDLY family) [Gellertiella hungarica]|uniref:Putative O-linked N-acetylglucosamine transferase (SPINDLY family) n=2 Tax=Gellertiella hungarica TaxID=1572859 RepID=A0A7W6J495_9HYPH|nr:putative O-linked N-acetylglucosamine transferase (SPINDLY family) [Gellertiella hungarica]
MRERALAAVEHYVDILPLDDDGAAAEIRRRGIDILVDLKGFTQGGRLGIFARRPAPVQVSYLGFPGSVAGVGIDYAIADAVVAPASSDAVYEEKIVRLPRCYQSNDNRRPRPERPAARAGLGLPEEGIVFAAFHQAPKIRADAFAAWMEILRRVEASVLWLGPQEEAAAQNLRRAAQASGIAPERLVIAPKMPMADHLARLAAADIALDCTPCNGHTTTSDALWAGVPVVTVRGTSFAGRVSESLLQSVGLPELVADDLDAFVRLTDALARDGNRLSVLRHHLLAARDRAPLFDTAGLTRDLEAALAAMLA